MSLLEPNAANIKAIFLEALARSGEARESYLKTACGNDTELLHSVQRLLAAAAKEDNFLEKPLIRQLQPTVEARSLAGELVAGRYRILRELSRGGFATVYLARDESIEGKRVVVKVLDQELAQQAGVRLMLESEVRVLAQLSHPGVSGLTGVGELDDGTPFIVMQYVPGDVLRAVLQQGPMPPHRVLRLVQQAANALAVAHEEGILHLDLKPENIILTDTGSRAERLTIIDFGISRLREERSQKGGYVAGSPVYMAPEQKDGVVSTASDVFSLAMIVQEMLTGVVSRDPLPTLPVATRTVLRDALAADPKERIQSAPELSKRLEAAFEPGRIRQWRPWAAVAALAVALVTVTALWRPRNPSVSPHSVNIPTPLTTETGVDTAPAFAPDGRTLYFSRAVRSHSDRNIYSMNVATRAVRQLTTNPASDDSPACSPDGKQLAFFRDLGKGLSAVMAMPATGGAERRLAEGYFHSMTWAPDSRHLVVSRRQAGQMETLVVIDAATREEKPFWDPRDAPSGDTDPQFSPDGATLAFTRATAGSTSSINVVPVSPSIVPTDEPVQLISSPTQRSFRPLWTPDGKELLFLHGTLANYRLWRMNADGSALRPFPEPGGPVNWPTVPRDSWHLAYARDLEDTNVWELKMKSPTGPAVPARRVVASTLLDEEGRYSPDGKHIAFISGRSGDLQLWIANADGSNPRQITHVKNVDSMFAFWHPTKPIVAFGALLPLKKGSWGWAGPPNFQDLHLRDEGMACSYSRDGNSIYFVSREEPVDHLWRLSLVTGERKRVSVNGSAYAEESPDGKWLYFARRHEQFGVWRMPVGGGEEERLTGPLRRRNLFTITPAGLYYVAAGNPLKLKLRLESGQHVDVYDLPAVPGWGLGASPDGKKLLLTQFDQDGSNLYWIENLR